MAISPRDVELQECDDLHPQIVGASFPPYADERQPGPRRLATLRHSKTWESLPPQEPRPLREWRWVAVLLLACCLDLLSSGGIVAMAFWTGLHEDGFLLYCIGTQAVLHLTCSVALSVRFMVEMLPAPSGGVGPHLSEACLFWEERRRDLKREQVCAVFMGLIMMVTGCMLAFRAIWKIKAWDEWRLDSAAGVAGGSDLLAWWGFSTYLVEALVRTAVALRLRRSLLWHSVAMSVVSLAFLLVLGLSVSAHAEWSWKAEPIVCSVLVATCLCEGLRVIHGHLGDVESLMQQEAKA